MVFEGVSFRYKDEPVLEGLRLEIVPGSTTAIMGPNGSGKTKMIHLLRGFYRSQQGQVLADGRPYEDLDIAWLRKSIGVVCASKKVTRRDRSYFGIHHLDQRFDIAIAERECL